VERELRCHEGSNSASAGEWRGDQRSCGGAGVMRRVIMRTICGGADSARRMLIIGAARDGPRPRAVRPVLVRARGRAAAALRRGGARVERAATLRARHAHRDVDGRRVRRLEEEERKHLRRGQQRRVRRERGDVRVERVERGELPETSAQRDIRPRHFRFDEIKISCSFYSVPCTHSDSLRIARSDLLCLV
jgi:hypothetical protein